MKLLANKKFDYITRHYEGFEGAPISEWESFESVAEMAEFVEEYEELGGKLIEHYPKSYASVWAASLKGF